MIKCGGTYNKVSACITEGECDNNILVLGWLAFAWAVEYKGSVESYCFSINRTGTWLLSLDSLLSYFL